MRRVTVNLIDKAMNSLKEVADWSDTTPERAFEDVVCNALRAYHVVESSGFLRLIDDQTGKFKEIHFHNDSPRPSLWTRVVSKILGRKLQTPPAFQPFEAQIRESTAEDVNLQASLYGLSRTDLYNRLVIVGAMMTRHLGTIYAFNRTGDPLGEIELPLER